MVHCTDIAGGSTGQQSPDRDRMCRHAANGALLETKSFARTSIRFSLRRQDVLPFHDGGASGPGYRSRNPDPVRT